jgi:hypothetical protein
MPNYLNGKVYAIRSHQTEQVYIGSTVERLSARMSKHRAQYKFYKNGKGHYYTSFKMLDYPDAYIELLEKHPCLCREELERLEGQYIRAEPNAVNKIIAGRTRAEHYRDNAEQLNARQKEYYHNNTEKIRAQHKQKHDCPCGGKYTTSDKAKHLKTKKHQAYEQFMALTEEQVEAMLC